MKQIPNPNKVREEADRIQVQLDKKYRAVIETVNDYVATAVMGNAHKLVNEGEISVSLSINRIEGVVEALKEHFSANKDYDIEVTLKADQEAWALLDIEITIGLDSGS